MKLNVKTTRKKQILDITDMVQSKLELEDINDGICQLFVAHTTAALTTADLDPGTDQDILDAFEAIVPKLKYRHPHNPDHVGDHIMASIIGPSLAIPIEAGKLVLGTWQRIILVELDGPRDRQMVIFMTASN